MKNTKLFNYLINLSFFLYFIILLCERLSSVSLSFIHGLVMFSNGFTGYVYLLTFISIFSFIVFLVLKCRDNIKYIFNPNKEDISYFYLCIASGLLLLSGMVHTEYTTLVVQFISYGILIVGILLKVILVNYEKKDERFSLWLSFAFIVSFSMAIPVMYYSLIEHHVVFHVLEGVGSFALVAIFTYLLILIFQEYTNIASLGVVLLLTIFNAPIIIMRWNEEINYFVLIFTSLTILIYLINLCYSLLIRKRKTT